MYQYTRAGGHSGGGGVGAGAGLTSTVADPGSCEIGPLVPPGVGDIAGLPAEIVPAGITHGTPGPDTGLTVRLGVVPSGRSAADATPARTRYAVHFTSRFACIKAMRLRNGTGRSSLTRTDQPGSDNRQRFA